LRLNVQRVDIVFPEWFHLTGEDGRLRSADEKRQLYFALENKEARVLDPALEELLSAQAKPPQVMPLVNNFDPERQEWADVSEFLASPWAQTVFRAELTLWLAAGEYAGIVLDLEKVPARAQTAFRNFAAELASDLHSRGWKLFVAVPAGDPDFEFASLAAHADALIVMNYDQHFDRTKAGPVASHGWFTGNLLRIMRTVPAEKLICGIGNYGYEWPKGQNASRSLSVPDAWGNARRTGSKIKFDGKNLNPRYTYTNAARVKHEVWFLDAVTALNQMRVASKLGVNSFALWRLGAEDGALWEVWDQPSAADAARRLRPVVIPAAKTSGDRDVKEDRRTDLMNKVNYRSLPQ
jgi:spore germination protein YaaH